MAAEPLHATRVCRKCGVEKPLVRPHFQNTNGNPNTFRQVCWPCRLGRQRERLGQSPAPRRSPEERREINRAACLRAYANNREQRQAENRRRWHDNRERYREGQRRYYREHLAERKAADRAYRDANKEKRRETFRRWARANGHRFAEYDRRRRIANGSGVHFTAADLNLIWDEQGGRCTYCATDLTETCEADHFIPIAKGGGHEPENIVLACRPCNRSKWATMPWEWKPELFRPPPA
jgi:5-methylcytosine-specific restriction endonuclease McrA